MSDQQNLNPKARCECASERDHYNAACGASQLASYGIRGVLRQEQRAPHFARSDEIGDSRVVDLLRVGDVRT
jgi:hypothetical protein